MEAKHCDMTSEEREQFYDDWCEKFIRIMIPMDDRLWERVSWVVYPRSMRKRQQVRDEREMFRDHWHRQFMGILMPRI